MMKIDNYKEYDKLHVYVKKGLSSNIIEYYKLLGWQFEKKSENERYEDIVDLSFYRSHNIENKDELQLTQVYMEEKLNALGKIQKRKHSISTALALCFGVIGVSFLALGILTILNILYFLGLAVGITLTALGAILVIAGCILIPRIVKKEREKFDVNQEKLNKELQELCDKAKALTGVKDERNE